VETSRVALIRYRGPEGSWCIGSGLLVSNRHVLTADHVAEGDGHRVKCGNVEIEVSEMLRSRDPAVDLAVLTLSEAAGALGPLSCGQVDRSQVDRIAGCVAVGFPRWKKDGDTRQTAQVRGWVPTAEGLQSTADAGLRSGFLTLVGDRVPGVPPILDEELHGRSGSPWGGMSGAGVVAGNLVIGVVRSHNLAAGAQSLTVTPLTALDRLPHALRRRFCELLGIDDLAHLAVLAGDRDGRPAGAPARSFSPDVREAYGLVLGTVLASPDLPTSWNLDELAELRQKIHAGGRGISKEADTLTALCQALVAKPVFLALGGSRLELGQLQVIYRREIGAWPGGRSADALLAEAASAGIAEGRRHRAVGPLSALARFVIGVAAALNVPPHGDLVTEWIESMGHQPADAQAHYGQRHDDSAWLVIDLGDEPRQDAAIWPTTVNWTLLAGNEEMSGDPLPCEPTAEGLRLALTEILRLTPPAYPLLVDLVMPRALMEAGIEHWPILEVDGTAEPLSAECHPRLRWSRRRRDVRLHNRLLDRTRQASWMGEAKHWLSHDPRRACFLGGRDAHSPDDPLRVVLREGCGFVIWFPSGIQALGVSQMTKAIRAVPVSARRSVLPDQLPDFKENRPAVIWDDPQGRGRFQLPPFVVPESP
jgi:Trypsin-like peptidase domain